VWYDELMIFFGADVTPVASAIIDLRANIFFI
jgi:hypothetical protein